MTIEKGSAWGETVERPADLAAVADDAGLAVALARGDRAVAVSSGDMFATVGARPLADRSEVLRLPVDLLEVSLDGGAPLPAVAHVLVRAPRARGGPLRGPLAVAMNAEFIGGIPLAPRGHPNDGRIEVFDFDAGLSVRQRLAIRRRARSAAHLPHPGIRTRSLRSVSWEFDRECVVVVDGVVRGRARSIDVSVTADGGVLHA